MHPSGRRSAGLAVCTFLVCLVYGCGRPPPLDPATLEPLALRYVTLALALGVHDPNYVDAYYGPDSLRAVAQAESAKQLRFIDTYRSYVINYNLGRDVVAHWVGQQGGDSPEERWQAFGALLSSPRLPSDLN